MIRCMCNTAGDLGCSLPRSAPRSLRFGRHVNVLFQADGCAPIVAEIQVHHEQVKAVNDQDHKLYEIIRAESMDAAAPAKRAGSPTKIKFIKNDAMEEERDKLVFENNKQRKSLIDQGEKLSGHQSKVEEQAEKIVKLERENAGLKEQIAALEATRDDADVVRGPSTTLLDEVPAKTPLPGCPPPCCVVS